MKIFTGKTWQPFLLGWKRKSPSNNQDISRRLTMGLNDIAFRSLWWSEATRKRIMMKKFGVLRDTT